MAFSAAHERRGTYVLSDGSEVEHLVQYGNGSSGPRVVRRARREIEKVIVIVRRSRARRGDDTSLSEGIQRRAAEELCAKHGWKITLIVEHLNFTGKEGERLEEYVQMIERGEVDALVFYDIKRFARSVALLPYADRIVLAGGDLKSCAEPSMDIYDPGSRKQLDLGALLGQWERESNATYWDETKRRNVADGVAQFAIPGYRKLGADEGGRGKGTLVPGDDFDAVRECLTMLMTGTPPGQVAREMTARSVKTTTGRDLTPSDVIKLARRPILKGCIVYGPLIDKDGAQTWRHINRSAHIPMFTESEWERLQQRVPLRGPQAKADPKLLQGVLRCANCRHSLQFQRPSNSYVCGNERCRARASASAAQAEPYLEGHYLLWVEEQQGAAREHPDLHARIAELRDAVAEADADLECLGRDREMRQQRRRAWEIAVDDAEAIARHLRDELMALAATEYEIAESSSMTPDTFATLTVEGKRRAIAGAFPIVWARQSDDYDEYGTRHRLPMSKRLKLVPAAEAAQFELPRKGRNAKVLAPIDFGDGFTPRPRPENPLPKPVREPSVRPMTPAEVIAAVEASGGNVSEAARCEGIKEATMRYRYKRALGWSEPARSTKRSRQRRRAAS